MDRVICVSALCLIGLKTMLESIDATNAEEVGNISKEVLKLIDKIITMVTNMPLT